MAAGCPVRVAVPSAGAAEDDKRAAAPGAPAASMLRRLGSAGIGWRGRAGGAISGVAAARSRTPVATRFHARPPPPGSPRSPRGVRAPRRRPHGRWPRRSGPPRSRWGKRVSVFIGSGLSPLRIRLSAVRAAERRLFTVPTRDLQHAGDLGEAEPGAEDEAEHLPVGSASSRIAPVTSASSARSSASDLGPRVRNPAGRPGRSHPPAAAGGRAAGRGSGGGRCRSPRTAPTTHPGRSAAPRQTASMVSCTISSASTRSPVTSSTWASTTRPCSR